jgi:hypothetical protein
MVGFAAALAAGWMVLPGAFYSKVEQPLGFNHEVHTGAANAMACEDCHGFRENGSFAGIPKLEKCEACHAEPLGATESESTFVERYVKTGREPEWMVYSRQPDNAWFPHAPHVKLAGLKCEECHSGHGQTKVLRPLEANRITGYSRDVMNGMRMERCIRCHTDKELEHSCLDCHK